MDKDKLTKVAYIYDENLADWTSRITHIRKRAKMVHGLIEAYGLTDLMDCRSSKTATEDDLLTFHSNAYMNFLSTESEASLKNIEQFSPGGTDITDEFGLGYDCPTFPDMKDFVCKIAGGTLAAVDALFEGYKIAINWCGGWHHAQRNEASGFCYINDIVIGIQLLLKQYKRILYIDLDAHHGDGVENAFSYSNKVMTLSFHNYETGYFPGTGNVDDVGFGRGKYHSVNVPLKSGIVDDQYIFVFSKVFENVKTKFQPEAIVVQCGTDCIVGDPLGSFSLTPKSMVHCVQTILKENTPTIFLGGGGYHLQNTAKTWTILTSAILGQEIHVDIPEHEYFISYGPDFTLEIPCGLRKNENTTDYISLLIEKLTNNLEHLSIKSS